MVTPVPVLVVVVAAAGSKRRKDVGQVKKNGLNVVTLSATENWHRRPLFMAMALPRAISHNFVV